MSLALLSAKMESKRMQGKVAVKVGDLCMANVSTDFKLRKARLAGLKTDRIYYCYGIYEGTAQLLNICGNEREKSVCVICCDPV